MKFGRSSFKSRAVYEFLADLADLAKDLQSGSLTKKALAARLNKIAESDSIQAAPRRLSRDLYHFTVRLKDLAKEITERSRKIEKHSKKVAYLSEALKTVKKHGDFKETVGLYEDIEIFPNQSREALMNLIELADILLFPNPDENDTVSEGMRVVHGLVVADLETSALELQKGLDPIKLVDKLKNLDALARRTFAATYIWHGVEEFIDIAKSLDTDAEVEAVTAELEPLD